MIDLFEQTEDRTHLISELTLLESRSAIRRRERLNEISGEQAEAALSFLEAEQRRLVRYPLSPEVLLKAEELLDCHPLRALDAIQLATALLCREALNVPDQLYFVCEDHRLISIAASESLPPWKFADS